MDVFRLYIITRDFYENNSNQNNYLEFWSEMSVLVYAPHNTFALN